MINYLPEGMGGLHMSHAKQTSKRKHRACAVPLLGAAGLSLSLASGASAVTEAPAADMRHEITLGEEEISDVSLATFYVFDKENPRTLRPGVQLAGHGGCKGCGGCRGCGGHGWLRPRLGRLRRDLVGRLRRLQRWWLLVLEERRAGLVLLMT
jgi:hypothetical protein